MCICKDPIVKEEITVTTDFCEKGTLEHCLAVTLIVFCQLNLNSHPIQLTIPSHKKLKTRVISALGPEANSSLAMEHLP